MRPVSDVWISKVLGRQINVYGAYLAGPLPVNIPLRHSLTATCCDSVNRRMNRKHASEGLGRRAEPGL